MTEHASEPPPSNTQQILRRIEEIAPRDNARLQSALAALKESIAKDGLDAEEKNRLLAEFEQAYNKLTSPANRLAIFLDWVEEGQHALIALGDTEFVANVDPNVEPDSLTLGTRVRVNEAYAVVGLAGPSQVGSFAKVSEAPDEAGRLRIGGETPGSEGRSVLVSAALAETTIKVGDEVRLDPSGRIALEHVVRNEMRDYFLEEVPPIPWEAVGGQRDAIQLIRETIEQPLLHPEIFEQYQQHPVKGILLYGPPGCGKTLIGKATAHNLTQEYSKQVGRPVKEYFMTISGPKILNMWLGETERIVREIFKQAREKAKEGRLVFIFMDEAESVLRARSSGRYLNISNTVVPQFCAELDGLETLNNVILMLTSNRPDYIDPAVLRPGRIDRKVKISRPDREATTQILGIYLPSSIPLDPALVSKFGGEVDCARRELSEGLADFLWRTNRETQFLKIQLRNGTSETLYFKDLMSGAILKGIVDRAKSDAIKRAISGEKTGVTLEDLKSAALQEFRENEIFPKSDAAEDWLQLLDIAPDQVVGVKPIGQSRGEDLARKSVV